MANLLDFMSVFARPFLASAIMGASAIGVYKLIYAIHPGNLTATAIAILVAVGVYFVMVFLTGAVTREEMALVPKGETIYNFAVRLHLAK